MLSGVAVDYWWMPCRDVDEGSIGLPSQTFKRIWLRQWLASGELKMPGTGLGDCELEKLSWASSSLPKPRVTKKHLDNTYEMMKTNFTRFKDQNEDIVDNYDNALAKADGRMATAEKALKYWNERKASLQDSSRTSSDSISVAQEEEASILQEVAEAATDLETATKDNQTMVTRIAYCKGSMQEWEEAFDGMMKRQKDTEGLAPDDVIPFESCHSCTVGRLKGLPEAVTQFGEPILCNIIPGAMERPHTEVTGWLAA